MTCMTGFWGFGKRVTCVETGGQISALYTSHDVFLSCLLGVVMIAPVLKFFLLALIS